MNIQVSFSSSGSYTAAAGTSPASAENSSPPVEYESIQQLEKKADFLPAAEEVLLKKLEHAFKALTGPETMLDVSMHEETHSIMVKVLNKETGEVIREVPSEKTLDLVANMMQIAGILIDKRT